MKRFFLRQKRLASSFTSLALHTVGLLILALMAISPERTEKLTTLLVSQLNDSQELEIEEISVNGEELQPEEAIQLAVLPESVEVMSEEPLAALDISDNVCGMEVTSIDLTVPFESTKGSKVAAIAAQGFAGRGEARQGLVATYGGNYQSESAVNAGLEWIIRHQSRNGSWNVDHTRGGKCRKQCANPGTSTKCTTGATALALLPLLSAGNTHQSGAYKKQVGRGINYLLSRMKIDTNGGSLAEPGGQFYDHGLATMALSEAYGMTGDSRLREPAQLAINYTLYAQDPVGGGWRYWPHMPGDMSAFGWQLLALKSGQLAGLDVPESAFGMANSFLDSMESEDGSLYGYINSAGVRMSTTAIGLLSRMHLGSRHDETALTRGIEDLSRHGPSKADMYYNYYATLALRHFGGEQWQKWNTKMRDQLIASQATEGHEAGSWYIEGEMVAPGGRLYITSLCIMTLEVYYRYLPIYKETARQ